MKVDHFTALAIRLGFGDKLNIQSQEIQHHISTITEIMSKHTLLVCMFQVWIISAFAINTHIRPRIGTLFVLPILSFCILLMFPKFQKVKFTLLAFVHVVQL